MERHEEQACEQHNTMHSDMNGNAKGVGEER